KGRDFKHNLKEEIKIDRHTMPHRKLGRGIEGMAFSVIYDDEPWEFENDSMEGAPDYLTQSTDKLCEMAREFGEHIKQDAILFFWTTQRNLLNGDAHRVIQAYGFPVDNLKMITWHKTGRHGFFGNFVTHE